MTHLCLVSDQTIPNLLPILKKEKRPESVVLAVSSQMIDKAIWLKEAIKARGIEVGDFLEISDAYNINELQNTFLSWLARHELEDVVLNVTCGTKPMAIAAQEAFRLVDKPVFYVNVQSDEIMWLSSVTPSQGLTATVPVKTFLNVHGFKVESAEKTSGLPEQWDAFSNELAFEKAKEWEQALGKLNYHAMEAKNNNRLDVGSVQSNNCRFWDALMESLYYNEIIRYRDRLCFRSEEARSFANGGWLEHLVFKTIKDMDSVQDARLNVTIVDQKGNRNELDVALVARNRLFIVECKTKRLAYDQDEIEGFATDTIYKLDALRKTGGLRTKGVLVSYRPVKDYHKRRANEAGIVTIDQAGLSRLKELLGAVVS